MVSYGRQFMDDPVSQLFTSIYTDGITCIIRGTSMVQWYVLDGTTH